MTQNGNWTAPADTALLIVDVQNDFCPGGPMAVNGGDEIVPVINALRTHFNHVVLTQDYHPARHCSFASSHEGKSPFVDTVEMPYGTQVLWTDHCIQETQGAAFHKDLVVNKATDLVLQKGVNLDIDSYSGFYENDQTTRPTFENGSSLTELLNDLNVERVVVVGLAYDFCVGWTALDAVKDGFDAIVVKDASRSIAMPTQDGSSNSEQDMDKALKNAGAKLASSTDLKNILQP